MVERKQKQEVVKEFNDKAYTIVPMDNAWAVVELQLNGASGEVSPVIKVLEKNTEKVVVQERLHVLLMQEGLL